MSISLYSIPLWAFNVSMSSKIILQILDQYCSIFLEVDADADIGVLLYMICRSPFKDKSDLGFIQYQYYADSKVNLSTNRSNNCKKTLPPSRQVKHSFHLHYLKTNQFNQKSRYIIYIFRYRMKTQIQILIINTPPKWNCLINPKYHKRNLQVKNLLYFYFACVYTRSIRGFCFIVSQFFCPWRTAKIILIRINSVMYVSSIW